MLPMSYVRPFRSDAGVQCRYTENGARWTYAMDAPDAADGKLFQNLADSTMRVKIRAEVAHPTSFGRACASRRHQRVCYSPRFTIQRINGARVHRALSSVDDRILPGGELDRSRDYDIYGSGAQSDRNVLPDTGTAGLLPVAEGEPERTDLTVVPAPRDDSDERCPSTRVPSLSRNLRRLPHRCSARTSVDSGRTQGTRYSVPAP